MTEITLEHADGTFIRTGECCRCGECCIDGDPFGGKMGEPTIAGACPLLALADDSGLTFNCTDRLNEYYLKGCNVWPTHPAQIADKPSCTYKFAQVPPPVEVFQRGPACQL